MFLHPVTAEQCLHNALQVVEAFKVIQLDYDVVVRMKLFYDKIIQKNDKE